MRSSSRLIMLGLALTVPAGARAASVRAIAPDLATNIATADVASAVSGASPAPHPDPLFRRLFNNWKKHDAPAATEAIAVPSQMPLDQFRYSSPFGIRVDPFTHRISMHPGVDMAAPTGTPVHAPADGVVSRAGRAGGYGNLVEIDHGEGLVTRYGHLSRILVHDGERVHRGEVIGLVGSTGRSTGSHLHYEVRIAGRATNPMPFLHVPDYLMALEQPPGASRVQSAEARGSGGPHAG